MCYMLCIHTHVLSVSTSAMVPLIASCKNGAHLTMSTVPIGLRPKSMSGGAINDMPSVSMQGIGSLGFRWKYTRSWLVGKVV